MNPIHSSSIIESSRSIVSRHLADEEKRTRERTQFWGRFRMWIWLFLIAAFFVIYYLTDKINSALSLLR
jgi:hypothetical protein